MPIEGHVWFVRLVWNSARSMKAVSLAFTFFENQRAVFSNVVMCIQKASLVYINISGTVMKVMLVFSHLSSKNKSRKASPSVNFEHTLLFKSLGQWKKWILLFSKDV